MTWQGRRYPGRVTPPRKRLAIALALAAAGLCAAAGAGTAGAPPASAGPAKAGSAHPNVLVIETDDQTAASMSVMSNVNSRIVARGATFQNSFVNYSLCCPSRSTFLTGQYEHNHGVLGNSSPDGGFGRFESLHGTNNLAVWLQHSGYYTGLIGKYLNGYSNSPPVPPGWSEWHGAAPRTQDVYDYTINQNGTPVHYGTRRADFKQDVLTGKAVDFVDRRAPKPNPFFLWLTYTAPHAGGPNPNPQPPANCDGTAKPAPRHAHSFDSEPLLMPPNYNEADVSDKPAEISSRPPLTAADTATITRHYRCRLESLLSVDEGVNSIMDALKATGELSNTYVVFTSDNGFFHGEHRIPGGKLHIYEESIRVPLAIRGPGIPHGGKVRDLAINADLAPTIVDVTGARPRLTMDGRSLDPDPALHLRRAQHRREGALRPEKRPLRAAEPPRRPGVRGGQGSARRPPTLARGVSGGELPDAARPATRAAPSERPSPRPPLRAAAHPRPGEGQERRRRRQGGVLRSRKARRRRHQGTLPSPSPVPEIRPSREDDGPRPGVDARRQAHDDRPPNSGLPLTHAAHAHGRPIGRSTSAFASRRRPGRPPGGPRR